MNRSWLLTMVALHEPSDPGPSGNPGFERFIDKAEVGRRFGVSVRSVESWMGAGRIPFYRIGGLVRFKWSEVERHLADRCRVPAKSDFKP